MLKLDIKFYILGLCSFKIDSLLFLSFFFFFSGKLKNRSKPVNNQNGKQQQQPQQHYPQPQPQLQQHHQPKQPPQQLQPVPQSQPQQVASQTQPQQVAPHPQQVAPQIQPAAVVVPTPQPPKANNRSNKFKELNIKGANKEGTDMDAFNDNSVGKTEINANVLPTDDSGTVNDAANANQVASVEATVVVPPTETERKDSNENVTTTITPELNSNNVVTPVTATATVSPVVATKPVIKPFDVTSIIKDSAPKSMPPFPIINDNRDETDRASVNDKLVLAKNDVNNKVSSKESTNDDKPQLPYKPGQWAPDKPDGLKVYEKDFLLSLKNLPLSQKKPDCNSLPEGVIPDERSRQMDPRLLMGGGRTDFMNPPFANNFGGKSGSQRGTLPKRPSQSGKMGNRVGDKNNSKPQPKVSISLRGDVKLHESENAWKPARFNKVVGETMTEDDKRTESLYKKVRSVLNKLTPQKFDTLVNQVRQLQIDNKDRLQGVIDLVFEKAIDEPSFSLAYAMMCKEIQSMQVSIGEGEKKNLAFRTLLVTRCQIEFEKQSVDESGRDTKFQEMEACTDAEKKKELLFELEESERRLRMRSVGCIRFIGELFKQQMLTASIMRRCLQTLLDNKDEESLECLCKLLTTVGKELESKNVELVTIFDEMKRITDGKRQKVSSRIRFMLQDVIDLRNSKWIPRRGDANPKTMDQIQKEAENEQMNIQVMNMNPPRRDDRGGGGGGGGGGPRRGGNSSQKSNDENWSTVGSRNNRQQFSIQTDKMRVPKPGVDELFGPSKQFSNWAKGAGGSKNPQSSLNTSNNMYTALENVDMERRPMNSRGNNDPYSSKGPSIERNLYNKSYDGRGGSRSGSQHRDSNTPMRSTGPPPSSMMPSTMAPPQSQPKSQQRYQQRPDTMVQPDVPTATPAPPSVSKLSEEQIERRIRNSLDEFITGCCTTEEYFQDVASAIEDHSRVVYESYNYILEKSQSTRLKTGELFAKLIKAGSISVDVFAKGFEELLGVWEDLVIDIPQIWQYFAEDLVALLLEEVMPFPRLQKLLDSLIQVNVAKKLLKSLFDLVIKEKGSKFLQASWQASGMELSSFMPSEDVVPFVQENKFDFLLSGESPVTENSVSFDAIQDRLAEFFKNKASFDDIVNWISANVGESTKQPKFIRALATAIFEDSISKSKLQNEVLSSHNKLIQKYVDTQWDLELQCLYALQALIQKLEHPQGLLLSICDKLYEDSIFSQESFIAWENSTDPSEQEGKG
ncbi:unnamed protein product [Ceutorhynchus assimilis]|uniref:Eukaryotic translation initiation factor 4 gamma 1 n=1 Tax=Ceutorhynchus assimilis TaxID=467358 RepID=A0A9P0DJ50_9CUCU|nr:unnamed protein product [Ceutorhynchus assimilis]